MLILIFKLEIYNEDFTSLETYFQLSEMSD